MAQANKMKYSCRHLNREDISVNFSRRKWVGSCFFESVTCNGFGTDTVHMPRDSRVGGPRVPLKVPGQGQLSVLKIICLSFLLCDLSRFHEYIGRAIGTTREPDVANTPSASITPLALAGHLGASPVLNNTCQSSDDLEDAILGPLTLDFSNEVIDTAISDVSTDTRSGLMDGDSFASMTRRTK